MTPGEKGDKGEKGDTGIGIPIGGATGQQLTKKSATDYDFEWQTPAGAGDMLKSVYDSDGDGIVDNAEKGRRFYSGEQMFLQMQNSLIPSTPTLKHILRL